MVEMWKPIVGYEGFYEVSDKGNVRSLERVIQGDRGARGGRKTVGVKEDAEGAVRGVVALYARVSTEEQKLEPQMLPFPLHKAPPPAATERKAAALAPDHSGRNR